MNDLKVRRWAGSFGVAGFVVFLIALPTYFVGGSVPRLEDAAQFSAYVTRINTYILLRATLADPLILVGLLVFLAGFRHLIRQARQDYEWIATLVFGVGLVVIALWLVGDGLEAGAALDTSVKADPIVIRGLMEGSFPLYGAIGLVMSALLLASAGYATMGTRVLHKWTGWFAYGGAVANLAAAPSILGGTDSMGFYTATGWVTFIGQAWVAIWLLCASISMIVKR